MVVRLPFPWNIHTRSIFWIIYTFVNICLLILLLWYISGFVWQRIQRRYKGFWVSSALYCSHDTASSGKIYQCFIWVCYSRTLCNTILGTSIFLPKMTNFRRLISPLVQALAKPYGHIQKALSLYYKLCFEALFIRSKEHDEKCEFSRILYDRQSGFHFDLSSLILSFSIPVDRWWTVITPWSKPQQHQKNPKSKIGNDLNHDKIYNEKWLGRPEYCNFWAPPACTNSSPLEGPVNLE